MPRLKVEDPGRGYGDAGYTVVVHRLKQTSARLPPLGRDARIGISMSGETQLKPPVGVPWRTAAEEKNGNLPKIENYYRAVEAAGGEPVPISLGLPRAELESLESTLDAVVLPGSPSDVDPSRYGAPRHAQCADPDAQR